MDPITVSIITGLATNYFVQFTAPAVQGFFAEAFSRKPSLEDDLKKAQSTQDYERVFREAAGVIDAAAGRGSISIDRALLEAIRSAHFDHQHGRISIAGSVVDAPFIRTGGGTESTGHTHMTGSSLKSRGTRIDIGHGASIEISGGASIEQN